MKLATGTLLAFLLIQLSSGFVVPVPRITDGEDAKPGQFPYQVSIEFKFLLGKYRHVCGGSIINENYVLTAGHCAKGILFSLGKMRVKAGKHYLNSDDEHVQTSDVEKKIPHELFPGGMTPKPNDIALLKLKTPLVFNTRVKPVLLPKQDQVQEGDAVLSGWGSVSKGFLPKLPNVLQTAKLPILDQAECRNYFDGMKGSPGIPDTMVCSGPIGGSISACSGDSGGPYAQFKEGSSQPVLVGVVSWGTMPCGGGSPSVYTRVSSYVDWINEKISN